MEDRQYIPLCKDFDNMIKIIELLPCMAYETGIPGFRDVTSGKNLLGFASQFTSQIWTVAKQNLH